MPDFRSKAARDNRANQLNPAHETYHRDRGASPDEANRKAKDEQARHRQPLASAEPSKCGPPHDEG